MAEPITLEQAKQHLRLSVSDTSEDAVIDSAITDARGWVEDYTGLMLSNRNIRETISGFGDTLRMWPISEIFAVQYRDTAGSEVELPADAYFMQAAIRPALLFSLGGAAWPALYPESRITIFARAGFVNAEEINNFSPNLLRAMKVLITEFYDNRGAPELSPAATDAAKRLCRSKKRWAI